MKRGYKTGEFAELAGVTVRALHHYDRIGLLRPQRSSSGARLYSLDNLERLEQIAALKFLGIPLKEIKYLLGSSKTLPLLESLDFQLQALAEKRKSIDRAVQAIELATRAIRSGHATDASVLKKILETIDMQPQENSMRKYYSEQAWLDRAKLAQDTPAEIREQRSQLWKQLFVELEGSLELDPKCEAVQALTGRWLSMADAATGNNDGIRDGGISAWKDHANWSPAQQDAFLSGFGLDTGDRLASMQRVERVTGFIGRAIAQRIRSNWRDLYGPKQP